MNAGIRKILVKEKIINTDAPNFVRGISYGEMSLVVWDVLRFLNGRSVESAQDLGSEMLWMMGANATLMILAARGRSPLVSPENPFIRRNPREIVLPIVPVDRLARGVLYVQMHGKKMIEIPKAA